MKIKIIFLLLALPLLINAQHIQRRGFFGAKVNNLNDSLKKVTKLNDTKGVIITEVLPNSTASSLKLEVNDVIISVNGLATDNKKSFQSVIKNYRGNEEIKVTLFRQSKQKVISGKVIAMPLEVIEGAEVIYDEVPFMDGYLRLITSKPIGKGKFKSIFFIQGYTCAVMDNLDKHPYGLLIRGLNKLGYAVMRVEKPGMGDNFKTPDCDKIDYFTEVKAFSTGLEKLKTYDFVDQNHVFIFGHSLGGLIAPVIASAVPVKGVIVCGTTAISWYEYLLEMFRFQNIIAGADWVENENLIKSMTPLLYELLIQKKTPKEVSLNADYKKAMQEQMEYDGDELLWGRNYKYWQQIQDLNLAEYWKNVSARVLVIRGKGDFEAFSDNEHKAIVDIVNTYHPGNALFISIPNMDHAFAKSNTPAESYMNSKKKGYYFDLFNPAIYEQLDKWIKDISK
jgi:pimeloyl-ACP methyl ester carboxylesterase